MAKFVLVPNSYPTGDDHSIDYHQQGHKSHRKHRRCKLNPNPNPNGYNPNPNPNGYNPNPNPNPNGYNPNPNPNPNPNEHYPNPNPNGYHPNPNPNPNGYNPNPNPNGYNPNPNPNPNGYNPNPNPNPNGYNPNPNPNRYHPNPNPNSGGCNLNSNTNVDSGISPNGSFNLNNGNVSPNPNSNGCNLSTTNSNSTRRPRPNPNPNPNGCNLPPNTIIRNDTPKNIITFQSNGKNQGNAYLLNTEFNSVDGYVYTLVQFEGVLTIMLNNTTYTSTAIENGAKIVLVKHNTTTATIFDVANLTYQPRGPVRSDISTGCSVAVTFNFTSRITFQGGENTHPNAFAIFRLSLNGTLTKVHFTSGATNLGVTLTPQNEIYLAGTGITEAFLNNKRHVGEGFVNYFVGLIDNNDEIVWSMLGTGDGSTIPIVDLTQASSIRGSSLNVNQSGNLLVTGAFQREITLDQKYSIGNDLVHFWWGEIDSSGKWVRSEVITGGSGPNNFILGNSIVATSSHIHVTGTFQGSYNLGNCNGNNTGVKSGTPSVFYASAPNSCDGQLNHINHFNAQLPVNNQLQHHPRLVKIGSDVHLYTYYDTNFEHNGKKFLSKGSLNVVVANITAHKSTYTHIEGYEVNYNNILATSDGSDLWIGGSSTLGTNKTNAYLLVFDV